MSPASAKIEAEVVEVYNTYAAELLRFAESFARDPELARDAVQEIFLRYFVERRYGRTIEQPRAWLYQVTRNLLLDRLSAAARETASDQLQTIPDQRPNPERRLQHDELAREVAAALTPRELDCLRLRAAGFAYHEIGDALKIRPGTVGALLSRVSEKLRSLSPRTGLADALRALPQENRA